MQVPATAPLQLGRPFVGPAFDFLAVGGGLTFPLLAWLWWDETSVAEVVGLSAPLLVLLFNQAHFAASTVRLYTKPGAFESFPFLTMALPALTLVLVSGFVLFAGRIGSHLWDLYLVWSPFHYAAQTFGLASMYCYRSGCPLGEGERRMLRVTCLMPFFAALVGAMPSGHGLAWFVPISVFPTVAIYEGAVTGLRVLTFVLPALLFLWLGRKARGAAEPGRRGMPLISLSLLVSNGVWWVVFNYIDAFIWATVFHALQYLVIVSVFHVREHTALPGNRHGRLYYVLTLYAMCLGLGYLLFQCWPRAYMALGFGRVDSILMVIAVINIHHFVVDAYIWRIRRDERNRSVMTQDAPAYSR
jgi:hypothetical protein